MTGQVSVLYKNVTYKYSFAGLNSKNRDDTVEDMRRTLLYKEISCYPKWKVELLMKVCQQVRKDNFTRTKECLYGNLSKAFDLEQLKKFFGVIKTPEHKNLFLLQFLMGLRVGELKDIQPDFNAGFVRISNHKRKRYDYMPMYEPLRTVLERNPSLNYQPGYLRNIFRRYCRKAGLNYQYAPSTDGRNMHQFTTHSLRHSAITFFNKAVNGNVFKVCLFSRHEAKKQAGIVATYSHYQLKDLKNDLESTFGDIVNNNPELHPL